MSSKDFFALLTSSASACSESLTESRASSISVTVDTSSVRRSATAGRTKPALPASAASVALCSLPFAASMFSAAFKYSVVPLRTNMNDASFRKRIALLRNGKGMLPSDQIFSSSSLIFSMSSNWFAASSSSSSSSSRASGHITCHRQLLLAILMSAAKRETSSPSHSNATNLRPPHLSR